MGPMNAPTLPQSLTSPEAMAEIRATDTRRSWSPSFPVRSPGQVALLVGRGGSAWAGDAEARQEFALDPAEVTVEVLTELLVHFGDQLRWGCEGAPEGPIAEENRFYGVTLPDGSGWMTPTTESTAASFAAEVVQVLNRPKQ